MGIPRGALEMGDDRLREKHQRVFGLKVILDELVEPGDGNVLAGYHIREWVIRVVGDMKLMFWWIEKVIHLRYKVNPGQKKGVIWVGLVVNGETPW